MHAALTAWPIINMHSTTQINNTKHSYIITALTKELTSKIKNYIDQIKDKTQSIEAFSIQTCCLLFPTYWYVRSLYCSTVAGKSAKHCLILNSLSLQHHLFAGGSKHPQTYIPIQEQRTCPDRSSSLSKHHLSHPRPKLSPTGNVQPILPRGP